jgi:hypothetical protein
MLILHLHLIQSALGQKVEAKPRGSSPRERSQGRAVMPGHEVACLPGRMGLPLGWSCGRASPFRAKSVQSGSFQTGLGSAQAVSGAAMTPVFPAITFCTWFARFTDEIPRRPGLGGRATASYKSYTKGLPHASVAGTGSPRPRLRGRQQSQSRSAHHRFAGRTRFERQNLRVPRGPFRFMGSVSPATTATKWPGGTSSLQIVGLLRNKPQRPVQAHVAVSPR